jgi:hypothetical protein
MSRDSDAGQWNKTESDYERDCGKWCKRNTHRFLPALHFTGKGIIAGYTQRVVPLNVAVVPEGPYSGGDDGSFRLA